MKSYCWKCNAEKEILDVIELLRNDGSRVYRGNCITCESFCTKSKGDKK